MFSAELCKHPAVQSLSNQLDLEHTFGYIKLVAFPLAHTAVPLSATEITTGLPQGAAAAAANPFSSQGELDQDAPAALAIPQVVSFEDMSSIVLEKQEETQTHRYCTVLHFILLSSIHVSNNCSAL